MVHVGRSVGQVMLVEVVVGCLRQCAEAQASDEDGKGHFEVTLLLLANQLPKALLLRPSYMSRESQRSTSKRSEVPKDVGHSRAPHEIVFDAHVHAGVVEDVPSLPIKTRVLHMLLLLAPLLEAAIADAWSIFHERASVSY